VVVLFYYKKLLLQKFKITFYFRLTSRTLQNNPFKQNFIGFDPTFGPKCHTHREPGRKEMRKRRMGHKKADRDPHVGHLPPLGRQSLAG